MKVLVVNNMTPFVRSRSDVVAGSLATALVQHGHDAELLRIPFSAEPPDRVPSQMLLARWLEIDYVDHVIALTFPAFLIRHARKTVWLLDPHHASGEAVDGGGRSDVVRSAEYEAFTESRAIFVASQAIGERLRSGMDVTCAVLPPPEPGVDASTGRDVDGVSADWSTTIEHLLR